MTTTAARTDPKVYLAWTVGALLALPFFLMAFKARAAKLNER